MTNYFLKMIQHLHQEEEVLLYANILEFSIQDQHEVVAYLREVYAAASLDYPYQAPEFDENAALWAAHTLYMSNQLLLYRENAEADLGKILPYYTEAITPSAILSADLTLRFLPDVISELSVIDPDDALIPILESHLLVWHYSGVHYKLDIGKMAFATISKNPCLKQLYCDRIIQYKHRALAQHPLFHQTIKANLGIHAATFWKDFELEYLEEDL